MKKRSIISELEKIDKKIEGIKAKKIVELYTEFTNDPIGFMGLGSDMKQEIISEILTRKITPNFVQEPRSDKFSTYREWNWLQKDPQFKDEILFGLNLKAEPFLGEHHDIFSVVEIGSGDEVKLLFDDLHPCNSLKEGLDKKDNHTEYFIDRCQKLLISESDTFEKFVEKVKKKEDYFDLMAKEQLPS